MTKTEQAILAELSQHGRFSVCLSSGTGGGGGRRNHGQRNWNAAAKLVASGRARKIQSNREVEYNSGNKMSYHILVIGLA